MWFLRRRPDKPVKITIVGCGAVAHRLYRQPLQSLSRRGIVLVTALVDSKNDQAQSLRAFFPGARVHEDLSAALRQNESELTLVLSPPHVHAAHALIALAQGNHVLCEKPLAANAAQGTAMIAAASQAKRILAVGMVRRFFPAFAMLQKWIEADELGEIRSLSYREGKVFDWQVATPAVFTKSKEGGGGVLLDIGTHALDYLFWLFGTPKVLRYTDDALDGVEANVTMALQWSGCTGRMQLSWDTPLQNELRINGSKAEAVLRLDEPNRLALRKGGRFDEVAATMAFAADVVQPARATMCPQLYSQSILCQLIQVVRAIRLGEAPAVAGECAAAVLDIIESARRDAEPLEMDWLDPALQQMHQSRHWSRSMTA